MTIKEIWYGKPLSAGHQTRIMEFLWTDYEWHSISEIADKVHASNSSISAAISNLKYAGWIEASSDMMSQYRAVNPHPVEDKRRRHHRNPRRTPRRIIRSEEAEPGDLMECSFISNIGSIWTDKTGDTYRRVKVEIRDVR
jgi:DNA-binding MarR family transcriptional regulator